MENYTPIKGMIIIEGIDGCGKGVVMSGIAGFLEEKGISVGDLRDKTPKIQELQDFGAILTCEPTAGRFGLELRNIILRNLQGYSARQTAETFANDREILYANVLIPASKVGTLVFQDRSFISSLVYQTVQAEQNGETLTGQSILGLSGNHLALNNPPGLVIVQQISPETAYRRLYSRTDKKDNTDFEKIEFLKKISDVYDSLWWRALLQNRGTRIINLDCNGLATPEATQKAVIQVIEEYLDELES